MAKVVYCSEWQGQVFVMPDGTCSNGHGAQYLSAFGDVG